MNGSKQDKNSWSLPLTWIVFILIISVLLIVFGVSRLVVSLFLVFIIVYLAVGAISIILHKGRSHDLEVVDIGEDDEVGLKSLALDQLTGDWLFQSCAVAADGGSLMLVLNDGQNTEFSLVLDRAIGSETYERIKLNGDVLVEYADEVMVDEHLRKLQNQVDDDVASDMIQTFIDVIKSRNKESDK